ncbi:hypothetical protein BDV38DRAFT_279283 [Aspergillus pseudotamarii]|uniref:Dickkopf N-terminal cysteine-rich domain-containing protein n=1 Tax=Aspergillus pseudotamarii TaxID=132259 RepID=A0A5N6T509_ASPPS|nr:uncharacterized protein BDV38DRAFT_279283 [Aspergillus pseudotamarii]KAE8141385.1 hypothetical protein BDV38DRAFT_279283 [Aspergillus pseudotamarii]
MKASTILLCVFAAFGAATEGDPTVVDNSPTPTQAQRTVAPTHPIKFSDLTQEEAQFVFQYMREHLHPPFPGTEMPGGWKWPAKRDGPSQPGSEFDPELSKLIHTIETLPRPQGKLNHYIGVKLEDKDHSNEDEDDSTDVEGTSPATPLERRKQNPCKRGCRADFHCCPGDRCFYGVCLGPQKPPRDAKREIYERYAPADETTKSEEDDENVDGTRFEGERDNRCARHCENDSTCCKSDKCVMGVCLGAGQFP